jgi:ABC-2 type transport system permease protein
MHQLQLKIVAVDSNIDIFPERRSFSGTGHFVLQNKYPTTISQVHISDAHPGAFGAINVEPSLSNIKFNRPFHIVSVSSNHLYTIYQFDTPVAPGETVDMTFSTAHTSRGFRDGHEIPDFAYSGTFFDNSYFPTIGYDTGVVRQVPHHRQHLRLRLRGQAADRHLSWLSHERLASGWPPLLHLRHGDRPHG